MIVLQQILDNPVTREHLLQYLNEKDLIKMSKVNFFKKYALSELSERYHRIVYFQNGFNFPRRKFDDIVKSFNTIEKVLHPAAIIFDDGILSTDLMHNYSSKILIWSCNDFTGKYLRIDFLSCEDTMMFK
uniref:F-box domain-containing protein n=1 Tax=Onchocerca volvulus TaxID=6282 RepID=A0A8R1TPW7_ONCVO